MQKRKFPAMVRRWLAGRNVHQAAKVLGVWDNTLTGYLDGTSLPTLLRIAPIAKAMRIDVGKVRQAIAHDRALRGREVSEVVALVNINEPSVTGIES